jgi:hypothetical protein
MPIRTVDVDLLAEQTGSIYESVVILSRRARQIATNNKAELDEKLSYFEGFDTETEDPRLNEDQIRTSVEYERRPKPTELSINEMFSHEIYFRNPEEEVETRETGI